MSTAETVSRLVDYVPLPVALSSLTTVARDLTRQHGPGLVFAASDRWGWPVRTAGRACFCHECIAVDATTFARLLNERYDHDPGLGRTEYRSKFGMVVCALCGNKRCPHAASHGQACTSSNEPGQPGSVHPSPEGAPR